MCRHSLLIMVVEKEPDNTNSPKLLCSMLDFKRIFKRSVLATQKETLLIICLTGLIPKHVSSAQQKFRILTHDLCVFPTETTSALLSGWIAPLPRGSLPWILPSQNPKWERREKQDWESLRGRGNLITK